MRYKYSFLKSQLIPLLAIVPLLLLGCKKDVTDSTNITACKWELKSITTNGETEKTPKEDPPSYILIFENDSTFRLDLSTNIGGGKYNIKTKGEITIESYSNFTEIAQSDFDDKLIEVFNEVTTYKVIGKTLIFKSSKGEVEFKRE